MSDGLLKQLTGARPRRSGRPPSAHLIGIAGAGMQALAEVLLDHQWRLSGSDRELGGLRESIATVGRFHGGHDAGRLPHDADLVIYSTAVSADNVERRRATELAIASLSYPRALGRIFRGHRCRLAVAGTHGKSTTVAMTDEILGAAGCDPTVIAGGVPLDQPSAGRAGRDDLALVEACEYERNFLHLQPSVAVILGIELDHFDCYDSLAELDSAFARFASQVDRDGLLIVRRDCPHALAIAARATCRTESFGLDSAADWQAERLSHVNGRWSFELKHRGRRLGGIRLNVPGRHNVFNALAAAELAGSCGAGFADIKQGLSQFRGIARRLETIGTYDGVTWIDDYAHHPTEVAASLEAVRRLHPRRTVWCVFQPHQASRTRRLLDEFAHSLQNADKIVVAEVFRAREPSARPEDVSAADLAAAVRRHGAEVIDRHATSAVIEHLGENLTAGDVVITMGAGDIGNIRDELVNGLRRMCPAG